MQVGPYAALGILLFGSAACQHVPPQSAPPEGVEIRMPAGGPPLNEHFSFEVLVPGAAPAFVRVDADMPAHGHGMVTKPQTVRVDEGRYRVDGMLLHMPGDWVVFVDVERNGETSREEFPLSVDF